MQYINPFELLNITSNNLNEVSNIDIIKAKRKLIAEIELSDNHTFSYSGIELNKGDCLKAIDDLDIHLKKEFHFNIFQNIPLDRFLTKGDPEFFYNYQSESIYKDPKFIDFISGYFSAQYNKVLSENFKKSNFALVSKLLSITPLTNVAYYENCYRLTYSYVSEIKKEIDDIINDIKISKSSLIADDFSGLETLMVARLNIQLINLLPYYFQVLRNQLAFSISNLAVLINNDPYNLYDPAYKVIKMANNISTDALTKKKLTTDYSIIKNNYQREFNEQQAKKDAEFEVILLKWKTIASQIEIIRTKIEKTENSTIQRDLYLEVFINGQIEIILWDFSNLADLINRILDPSGLNAISNDYQRIRNNVTDEVHSLAKTLNNSPHHNFKEAYAIISIAKSIKVDGKVQDAIAITFHSIKNNFDKQVLQQKAIEKLKRDEELAKQKIENGKVISGLNPLEWTDKINQIETIKREIKNGQGKFNTSDFFSLDTLISQIANVPHLNSLSVNFQGIRNQIAAKISSLAILINNEPFKKYDIAYKLICTASSIKTDGTVSDNISNSFKLLKGNFDKQVLQQRYISKSKVINTSNGMSFEKKTAVQKEDSSSKNQSNLKPVFLLLIVFGLIAFVISTNQKPSIKETGSKAAPANRTSSNIQRNSHPTVQQEPTWDNSTAIPSKPTYNFPSIRNGELSGRNKNQPRYNRSLDNKLIISCGSNADAAVKMIDYSTDKSIRYVYINKNSTFTIRNIPEGTYYLKIAYGDDWGLKPGETNSQGRFTSRTLCKKGEEILNYNITHHSDGSYQVPSYSLELNVIYTSNDDSKTFNTNNISENDFYNE